MGTSSLSLFGDLVVEDDFGLPVNSIRANSSDYDDSKEIEEKKEKKKRQIRGTYLKAGMEVKITKKNYSLRSITLWLLNNSECAGVVETLNSGYDATKETMYIEGGWTELTLLYLSIANHVFGDNMMVELSQIGVFNEEFYLTKSIGTKLDSELDGGWEYYKIPNSDWWLNWNGNRYHLGKALLILWKRLNIKEKDTKLKIVNKETYQNIKEKNLSVSTVFENKTALKKKSAKKKEDEQEDLAAKLMVMSNMRFTEYSKSISELIDLKEEPNSFNIKAIQIEELIQPVNSITQAIMVMILYAIMIDEDNKDKTLEKLHSISIKDMCGITKDQDELDRYQFKIQTFDIPNTVYTCYTNNILKYQLEFIGNIAKYIGTFDSTVITYEQLEFDLDDGEDYIDYEDFE